MIPRCEKIEIKSFDYSADEYKGIVLCCNLPCTWSYGDDGIPVEKACKHFVNNECLRSKGVWYSVYVNDCVIYWEGNDADMAKTLSFILGEIAYRNKIEFVTCFPKKERRFGIAEDIKNDMRHIVL